MCISVALPYVIFVCTVANTCPFFFFNSYIKLYSMFIQYIINIVLSFSQCFFARNFAKYLQLLNFIINDESEMLFSVNYLISRCFSIS